MNLQTLHKTLSTDERKALADAAGIKPEYLWQLANGFKYGPSLMVLSALCEADARLHITDLMAEFKARAEAVTAESREQSPASAVQASA